MIIDRHCSFGVTVNKLLIYYHNVDPKYFYKDNLFWKELETTIHSNSFKIKMDVPIEFFDIKDKPLIWKAITPQLGSVSWNAYELRLLMDYGLSLSGNFNPFEYNNSQNWVLHSNLYKNRNFHTSFPFWNANFTFPESGVLSSRDVKDNVSTWVRSRPDWDDRSDKYKLSHILLNLEVKMSGLSPKARELFLKERTRKLVLTFPLEERETGPNKLKTKISLASLKGSFNQFTKSNPKFASWGRSSHHLPLGVAESSTMPSVPQAPLIYLGQVPNHFSVVKSTDSLVNSTGSQNENGPLIKREKRERREEKRREEKRREEKRREKKKKKSKVK